MLQLLLQADEPATLWSLRASLLRSLSKRRLARSSGGGEAPCAEDGAPRHSAGAATCTAVAVTEEFNELASHLRRWQQAQVQAHQGVQSCIATRPQCGEGTSRISLRELSMDAADQCRKVVELHQAVRGQIGCLSL